MTIKSISIFGLIFTLLLTSCKKDKVTSTSNVLLLKVDYRTNTFEGGKEFTFPNVSANMTITHQYVPPGDFGKIKLSYKELNETLFDGSIVWGGLGQMNFPENLLPPNQFAHSPLMNLVYPNAGFENVFNPHNEHFDYSSAWDAVQGLEKVREYLISNPNASVKIFLYTPSVGRGNTADWDWIILMKN